MSLELNTPNELVYQFLPVTTGSLHFKVRAANDAHIALTSGAEESDPMWEVFIGGWSNSKSVIRKNRAQPDVVEGNTPGILSANEFRGFWISWADGTITVGKEGQSVGFLTWTDPEAVSIGYYGICTGWGASGSWIIEAITPAGGRWVAAAGGEVPEGAVPGGFDQEQVYVARAQHEGDLIPGKLVPSHHNAYVSWDGAEFPKAEYEVLCGTSPQWVPSADGQVPAGALEAGKTEDGETLYVGRVDHNGSVALGKVQVSHKMCYVPYDGKELHFREYEVLVSN